MALYKQSRKSDSEYGHILTSFRKINSFNKLVSNCLYYSISICHSNTNLNVCLTTIHKAGAIIETPSQILSLNKVEKYLYFLSNYKTPRLFNYVLFLHFKQ